MRTKIFGTNFLNTPRGPGRPGRIPGISQIPLFETQGRQTFEGGHELFGHHPFAWNWITFIPQPELVMINSSSTEGIAENGGALNPYISNQDISKWHF